MMKIKFNKKMIFTIVFFIVSITLLQTYHYYKFNYYKNKNMQHRLDEKILYLFLLIHKKGDVLQELLIDFSKDAFKIINLDEIDSDRLKRICTAWNDELFHASFIKTTDKQNFNKTINYLDQKCHHTFHLPS